MPWNGSAPNQTYGRSNGFNSGSTVWQQDDAASVDIVADRHDTHDQDIADAVNATLKKDGGNTATSNIPMGGFKFTNLAAGAARTDSIRVADVQDSKATYYPTVGGTADAITLTGAAAAITAYAAGQTFVFKAAATNTSAVTVNVDSVGVKSITGPAGTALVAGQIVIGVTIIMTYDGTQFQINTVAPIAISVGAVMAWPTATAPSGWLECNGTAVSRTTYSALFAVIGTSYGVGDASTTFNLPNYQDYFLRGFSGALVGDAASRTDRGDGTTGNNVGTKQEDQLESHTHTGTTGTESADHTHSGTTSSDGAHTHEISAASSSTAGNAASFMQSVSPGAGALTSSSNGAHTHTMTTGGKSATHTHALTSDATGGTETRPKNITVKWLILALPAAALPAYGGGLPAATGYTVSPRLVHTGGMPARVSTDGTNATPVTTETYIAECFVPCNMTATGIAIFNGATVGTDKYVVGLANSSGAVVANSALAGTTTSGADAYQRVPFTAAASLIGPATYFVLLQVNGTTDRYNAHSFGNFGASKKTGEVFGTLTTITPPTTFTADLGSIASLY